MVKALFQRFRDISIYRKIVSTYFLIITFLLVISGYSFSRFSTDMIVKKTLENSLGSLRMIQNSIDSLIGSIDDYATNLTMLINRDLEKENLSSMSVIEKLNIQTRIESTFNHIIYSYPNISSGIFISLDGDVFGSEYRPSGEKKDILDSDIVKAIDSAGYSGTWLGMQKRDYLVGHDDRNKYIITYGRKIINIYSGEPLGRIIVNVTEKDISSIYSGIKLGKTGKYLIIDDRGLIISSQNKEDILKPLDPKIYDIWKDRNDSAGEVVNIKGQKMLSVCCNYPKLQWKIIGLVPLDELTTENSYITLIVVIIGISCFIICIGIALLLSRIIARPINQLSEFAVKVTNGDLDAKFPVRSKDEVGKLGESLNFMIEKIKLLLGNIIKEQKQKRNFELQLIQSQIRPHFLYNSLELISSMAKLNMTKEVVDTVSSLSRFYRIALSKGSDIISIEKEMQNAESYLQIVKKLYIDIIDYSINIPQELYKYKIIKMSIQPIIENAVYHGLKPINKKGIIRVEGYKLDDEIFIKVIDNGAGMDEKTIEDILRGKNEGKNKSFGLKSVDDRIKLFFGETFGVTIDSRLGCGTTVTIKIPATEEEEAN